MYNYRVFLVCKGFWPSFPTQQKNASWCYAAGFAFRLLVAWLPSCLLCRKLLTTLTISLFLTPRFGEF